MAFDPQAYLASKQEVTTQPASTFDANNYLNKKRAEDYKKVFTDEPTILEEFGMGMVGEVLAINDFIGAVATGEFQTSAGGVPVMAGIDYLFSQANEWLEESKYKFKKEFGTVTKEDEMNLFKVKQNSTFDAAAERADKSIRDKTAYLNIAKNADTFLDWTFSKINKETEWKLVKKDLQKYKDKTVTNRALNWVGEHIHKGAEELKQEYGLPMPVGMALAELAMLKSNVVAKPLAATVGKISSTTGLTGTIKRVTGNSDLATINKGIELRESLGYNSTHLKEYKNAADFGKITQTDYGIAFDLPTPKLVLEALQNPITMINKKVKETKTEEDFVRINELTGRGLLKLEKAYTTLISKSLETKLNKLLGRDKELHYKIYNNIVDNMLWDSKAKYKKPTLSILEKQIKKDIFDPAMKEYNRLIKKLEKAGKLEKDIIIDPLKTGPFVPRRIQSPRPGFLKNVFGDYFKINDPYARYRPGSTSAREYFVAYNPITKERHVIALDQNLGPRNKKTGTTTEIQVAVEFKNGNKAFLGKDKNSTASLLTNLNETRTEGPITKSGEKLGDFEIREATRKDLAEKTNIDLVNEHPAVIFDRIAELRQLERDMTFEQNIKKSPYFKQNALKLKKGEAAPEGFKKVQEDLTQSYRDLDAYVYKDRAAEILEDANRPRPDTILTKVSDALVKNMMLNPIPHMHNELIHFYSTKGFMRTWSPEARKQFKEDMMWATKEVQEFGPTYREALSNGSSMMSTNVKNTKAFDNLVKVNRDTFYGKSTKDMSFWQKADRAANRQFGETYGGVSNFAQNSMWTVRDVMFMMLLKQKQRQYPNLTMKEHIQLVESHLPSYRIPIRVGEKVLGAKMSRALSKILQNQNIVIFARYKHGMISSGLNTIRDIAAPLDVPLRNIGASKIANFIGARDIAKGRSVKEQFKDGIDSGLALASTSFIIYPILDAVFQEIFGSDEAHVRRAGILHVLDTASRVGEGSREPYSLFQNLATVNPAVMLGTEIILNTTFYNGRSIYNVDDPFQYQVLDVLKKTGQTIPLASQIVHSQGDPSKVLGRQIDVKIPSEKQVKTEKRLERARWKAYRKRMIERGEIPEERDSD